MPLFQMPGSWFINAVGWTLVDCLWQSLLIWTLLQILLRATRGADPRLRYGISSAALAGIAVWFAVGLVRQCLLQSSLAAADAVHAGMIPAALPAAYQVHLPAAEPGLSLASRWLHILQSSFPALSLGYFTGVLICAIRLSSAGIRAGRLRGKGVSLPPGTMLRCLEVLKNRFGINRNVSLKLSLLIDVPLVTGWLKPVILVPVAAMTRLSPEQLEAILIHEMAHIRRQDYLVNLLQCITETLLCFNPLVWSISSTIRKERENCCDDMVVAEVNPLFYAHALVALEEQRTQAVSLVLAATQGRPQLFQRIKRMMEMKRSNLRGSQMLPTMMILAVAVASVAWLNPGHEPKGPMTSGLMPKTQIQPRDTVPAEASPSADSVLSVVRVSVNSPADSNGGDQIRIMGRDHEDSGAVNAKGQPLYFVNGVRVQGLGEIQPDQVESVSVLKDSAARVLYGPGGSNRVVLVTARGGNVFYLSNGNPGGGINVRGEPYKIQGVRTQGDSSGNVMYVVAGDSRDDLAPNYLNTDRAFLVAGGDSIPDQFSMGDSIPDQFSRFHFDRHDLGMDSLVWKKDVEKMISQLKQEKDLVKRLNQKDWDLIQKEMSRARRQYALAMRQIDNKPINFNYNYNYAFRSMDSLAMKKFVFADSIRMNPKFRIRFDSLEKWQVRIMDTAKLKFKMDSLMTRIQAKDVDRQVKMEMLLQNMKMKMRSTPLILKYATDNGTGGVQAAVQDMIFNHLIPDPGKYSVNLEKEALIIDGKKQSRETFEKYRDMVGDQTTFQVKHDHGNHESMEINSSGDKKSD